MVKDRVFASVITLLTGTALAQIITAVSMVVVTWLYSPEALGIISIYLAFFSFWVSLASWRFEGAMLVCKDDDESDHLFRLGSVVVVAMALISVPALYVLMSSGFLSFSELPVWSPYAAGLSVLGFGLFMMYRSWSLRLRELVAIKRATISRSAANAGIRIAGGVLGGGVIGLFIAEVLGSWAALAAVRKRVVQTRKRIGPSCSWNVKSMLAVGARYVTFPKYEMPSVALNQLASVMPVPMVGALYGAQAAGLFGVARLLVAIPNTQLGAAISDVFQMELAENYRSKQYAEGKRLFYSMFKKLALIGLVPLVASLVFAPLLVPVLLGDQWAQMGGIIAIMAPWMYFAFVVSSLSRLLSVLEAQRFKLYYDFLSLAMVVVVYFVSLNGDFDLYYYIFLISAGFVICYSVYFSLLCHVIKVRLA
ncbi:Membrane protein involved in the export of O-antigen and teichoic acid [Marinobacter zhejiangensis]|uniref:Membrane protein involved in the export of O-antigen and teichoic acid n=1 Tax=Marinobacter zhejiangensis TaxID=488535 RepID=A0A1I4QR17_9GAMM|nr:Membrane protein involved in the export of O-antigen and teichoic acid [Marinobacter zhejiangensis]